MWSHNSNLSSQQRCMCCYTPCVSVPSLCTGCYANLYAPINRWYNNVLPNYQFAPQDPVSGFSNVNNPVNPIFHVENNQKLEQMATNEIDSWLLLDREEQNNGNCSPWAGNQFNQMQPQGFPVNYNGNYGILPFQNFKEEQEHKLKFSQGIQHDFSRHVFNNTPSNFINTSLPPTVADISSFSNTTIFPREWGLNQLPFYPGNLLEETVGSQSNSSSEGTQQLTSKNASKKLITFPPLSRQERVLRYFEKKKARKYEKKMQHSSRKTFAQTRPRIRGRFARSSQMDTKTVV